MLAETNLAAKLEVEAASTDFSRASKAIAGGIGAQVGTAESTAEHEL
jgi:hypothetical protein